MNNTRYSSLVAKFYDSFFEDNVEDIEYLKKYYDNKSGTVLELATGTGRMLIPLLKIGIGIDGSDNSEEMLKIVSEKLKLNDLKCNLFNLDMTNIKISKKYDNVLIASGSFMNLNYNDAKKCLYSIKNVLKTDGGILIDLFIPWEDIRIEKTNSFIVSSNAVSGNERCIVYESFRHSINEQTKYSIYKYEYYKDDVLISTELNDLNIRWYYEKEIEALLGEVGYSDMQILRKAPDYSRNDRFIISAKKKETCT